MDAGQSVLENVDIKNCEASFGAGIYAKNTKLKLANTVFEENRAINESESDFALGGGMVLIDASIEANRLHFSNNTSSGYGGAIYVVGQNIAVADLCNSSFMGNQAELFGGTIFATGKSIVKVNKVSNNSNVAGVHGGACCIAGDAYLDVKQCNFYGNICANRDKYAYGSALTLLQNASAHIEETTFSSNEGSSIAFIQPYDVISHSADIKKCRFEKNKHSNLPSEANEEGANDFIAISIVPARFWRFAAGKRKNKFFWPFSQDNHCASNANIKSIFYQLPTDNQHVQKIKGYLDQVNNLGIK